MGDRSASEWEEREPEKVEDLITFFLIKGSLASAAHDLLLLAPRFRVGALLLCSQNLPLHIMTPTIVLSGWQLP